MSEHAVTLPATPRLPDRFTAVRPLGKGASGEVWLVVDHASEPAQKVAKILGEDLPAGLVEAFRDEFRILASLDHPGLAHVFDYGEMIGGRAFYTSEFVEGRDLLSRGTPTIRDACLVIAAVCRALAYIHARGCVHNDIKPSNILVGESPGTAKLLDFGLVGLARTGSPLVYGTPGYIAPERLAGKPWDARSDLYSIGATLYRMLGGRRTTESADPVQALRDLQEMRPSLSELRPDVPAPLSALVERLLAIDIDARPRHAFEIIAALGSILGEVLPLETLGSARCYALSSFMVGREAVLADVERVVNDALGGARRHVVAITGRPGLGKTRLAREVAWRAASGVKVASVRCGDHPGIEGLRRAIALLDGLPGDTPDADAAAAALLAAARNARRGALVMFDDAHLATDAVLRALFQAARRSADERGSLVILLTLDADVLPTAGRQRLALACASGEAFRVELGPLAGRELTSMLESLFGHDEIPKAMELEIAERSGGNPLLLEEIVRELVETGVIRSTASGWTVGESRGVVLTGSARLEDFLRRRCAALPRDALWALAALSALGTHATMDEIGAVAGGEVDVELGVALAAERDLVTLRDRDVSLEQEVVRGIALRLVPEDARLALARAAVAWLVSHGADDADLARAYRTAGQPREAYEHALRAAQTAVGSAEGAVALRTIGDARALADELGVVGRERATMLVAYATACELVGQPSQAMEAYASAFASLPPDDHVERVRAATGAVLNALTASRASDAEAWLERAREAADGGPPIASAWLGFASGLVDTGLRAGGETARSYFMAALEALRTADDLALRARILTANVANEVAFHTARTEQAVREAAAAAERAGVRDYQLRGTHNLAHVRLLQGDMSARGPIAELARELERSGNLYLLAHVLSNLVLLELGAGDWQRAREHADRLAALTDDVINAARVHCLACVCLSWWVGDAAATLREFERLRERTETALNYRMQWLPFGVAAAAACGDAVRARAWADEAERVVAASNAPALLAFAKLARAYATAATDPAAGAPLIEQAAFAVERTGHKDRFAVLLRDAGDVFVRASDVVQARRCYGLAREAHIAVGCADGLAQIEKRLALLGTSRGTLPPPANPVAELDDTLRRLARSLGLASDVRLSTEPLPSGPGVHVVRAGDDSVSLVLSDATEAAASVSLLVQVARAALRAGRAEPPANDGGATTTTVPPPADDEASRLFELTVGPTELHRAFDAVVGRSPAIVRALAVLDRLAVEEAPVLLTGETGTGKEVLARALHQAGPRATKPFVAVNCAAIPSQLFESELFGHRRGAFTGASRDQPGLARMADGGILFLDEIGELPLELQPKLLRLIQERRVRAVGADAEHTVDVRVVTATNRSLEDEVKAGRFRPDLYYRLNVVEVRLPPLRDRPADIVPLAQFFLARQPRPPQRLTPRALRALRTYSWPGNVRELENEIQRASIFAGTGAIESRHLSPRVRAGLASIVALPTSGTLAERIATLERDVIARAMADARGNRTKAAIALGITRQGLSLKLQRLNLEGSGK